MRKKFLLFGATGSIGDSTLDILRQHSDDFELAGFTWHNNEEKAMGIASEFGVKHFFSTTTADAVDKTRTLLDLDHDFIIVAIVGAAGVGTTLEAANRGEIILLANKESLVIAGDVVNAAAAKSGAKFLPVDSEHSSLWRLLPHPPGPLLHNVEKGEKDKFHPHDKTVLPPLSTSWGGVGGGVKTAYLTASGGPLLHVHGDDFYNASKALVLKHPTWVMGQKITVDSAGLTNKALEVIEAHYLFNLPYEKIEAVIHPQSYVHAMVEHSDGTVTQHVSQPDMRYPIAYAMYYPQESKICVPAKAPSSYPALEFYPIDETKFRSYALGRTAGIQGKYFPAVYNAANEAAVAAFLADEIRFGEISELIERALAAKMEERDFHTIEGLMHYDQAARSLVQKQVMHV
jgi:1-deoxy-D-xylulose-5-phosphate reductoisomerase